MFIHAISCENSPPLCSALLVNCRLFARLVKNPQVTFTCVADSNLFAQSVPGVYWYTIFDLITFRFNLKSMMWKQNIYSSQVLRALYIRCCLTKCLVEPEGSCHMRDFVVEYAIHYSYYLSILLQTQ